jgi:hypothetical protein
MKTKKLLYLGLTLFALVSCAIFHQEVIALPVYAQIALGVAILNIVPPQMHLGAITEGLCLALQTSVNELAGQNSPEIKRDPTGYISALQSPENKSGITAVPVTQTGQTRDVRITGLTRGTADDVTTTAFDCLAPEERAPWEDTITVNRFVRTVGHSFSSDEMRKLCEGPDEYRARVINTLLNPATVKLNQLALALQAANFGKFLDATVVLPKDVIMLTADNKAEFFGESTIMEDYEDVGGKGRPLVIGSGKIGHYARMADIGCCNDGGQDMGQAGAFDFYRDRFAGTVFGGADRFAVLEPGAVQLITFNKNQGAYAQEEAMFAHGTLVDPYTGIKWDLDMNYNPCPNGKDWKIWLSLWYEVYFMPTAAYAATDDLYETNGTFHYNATKAV